jgi:hypothetical protein
MGADVVWLDDHRPPCDAGNGAREALMALMPRTRLCLDVFDAEPSADWLLASLWHRGYKVVPLDEWDCGPGAA